MPTFRIKITITRHGTPTASKISVCDVIMPTASAAFALLEKAVDDMPAPGDTHPDDS